MANYIEETTGHYPVSESQIKAENRQVSFPRPFVAPEGYALVFPAPTPTHDPITHYAREIAPKLINGHYEQDYEVVALDAATVAANQAAAHKTSITNQITALEAQVTGRRIREAIRGSGKQWLDGVDDQIAALRAQL